MAKQLNSVTVLSVITINEEILEEIDRVTGVYVIDGEVMYDTEPAVVIETKPVVSKAWVTFDLNTMEETGKTEFVPFLNLSKAMRRQVEHAENVCGGTTVKDFYTYRDNRILKVQQRENLIVQHKLLAEQKAVIEVKERKEKQAKARVAFDNRLAQVELSITHLDSIGQDCMVQFMLDIKGATTRKHYGAAWAALKNAECQVIHLHREQAQQSA